MFCFQFEPVVVFIPPAVSPVRVSLAGSGCVEAVRFADGGVCRCRLRDQWKGRFSLTLRDVSVGNEGGLAQPALALAVLALKQVACSLTATEDLARTSDFEALGDGFPCLCFSRDSWHGAGRLGLRQAVASQKWRVFSRPLQFSRLLRILFLASLLMSAPATAAWAAARSYSFHWFAALRIMFSRCESSLMLAAQSNADSGSP